MYEKIVSFIGHSKEIKELEIDKNLTKIIENLIKADYKTFYCTDCGTFNKKALNIVCKLKKKYLYIQIFSVELSLKETNVTSLFDGVMCPDLNSVNFKSKFIERNYWIVEHCDVLVCMIENWRGSSAAEIVKYAHKIGCKIILV